MDPEADLVPSTGSGHLAAMIELTSYGFCCVTRSANLPPGISKVLAHLASMLKVTKLKTQPL